MATMPNYLALCARVKRINPAAAKYMRSAIAMERANDADSLSGAFVWQGTPQRHAFWAAIDQKLQGMPARLPSKRDLARAAKEAAAAEAKKNADAAARAAARTALPIPAQKFLSYLDANIDAFGCQRGHVIATVGAILGVDLTPHA